MQRVSRVGMFRSTGVASTAVLLSACLVAVLAGPASADTRRVGAGIYGVYGIPIIQEDVGAGPLFGAKLHADLAGPLGAELFYTSYQEGDVTFNVRGVDQTLPGGTQSVLGINAILGGTGRSGVGPYLTAGVGSCTLAKEHREDVTRLGFNGGIGFELRSNAGIAVDLSARAHVVPLEDGGSRKFGAVQAGLNYYFIR